MVEPVARHTQLLPPGEQVCVGATVVEAILTHFAPNFAPF